MAHDHIEGLLAFSCGTVFILMFPKDPTNPVSILGVSYFDERERYILRHRVILDDKTKSVKAKKHVTRGELVQVVSPAKNTPAAQQPPVLRQLTMPLFSACSSPTGGCSRT